MRPTAHCVIRPRPMVLWLLLAVLSRSPAPVRACLSGQYSPSGSGTDCTSCQAGKYRSGINNDASCFFCPAGRYSALAAISCSACPVGKYTGGTGATLCQDCSGGYYSATSAGTCSTCSAGRYSGMGASACTTCVAGKWATSGSSSCTDCAAGKYAGITGTATCSSCAAGYYSTSAASSCTQCAAGTYTTTKTSCLSCSPNYSGAGASVCVAQCPAGQFASASACFNCVAGTFQPSSGTTACLACLAGSFCGSSGLTTPSALCASGTYSAGTSTACTNCAAGHISDPGASSCTPTGASPAPVPAPISPPTPAPVAHPFPVSSPTPAATDVVAIAVSFTLGADSPPDGSSAAIIKASVTSALSFLPIDMSQAALFKNFELSFETARRHRRLLVTTYLWGITFDVVVSLSMVYGAGSSADREVLVGDIFAELSALFFPNSLASGFGFPVVVQDVRVAPITEAPTSQPTSKPTRQPSRSVVDPALPSSPTVAVVPVLDDGASATNAASTQILMVYGVGALVSLSFCLFLLRRSQSESNDGSTVPGVPSKGARILVDAKGGGKALMIIKSYDASTGVVVLGAKGSADVPITLAEYRRIVASSLDALEAGNIKQGDKQAELTAKTQPPMAQQDRGEVYRIPRSALKMASTPFAAGGGGQIFRGKYMGHDVAVKQVFSSSADDRTDFEREVTVLCKLSHPSIITLYGTSSSEDGGVASFMILEFCGGGDLAHYYKTLAFTNREFNRVIGEVLSAVSYLHARGIAHRDLKPANVLLETASLKVKVCDFGLAKGNKGTVTKGVGTPAYMAPELMDDDPASGRLDPLKVDVYALGVIACQLWTRKPPFEGLGVHAIINAVSKGKRPKLAPPASLEALCSRCWAQAADDRPTIEEVRVEFEGAVAPAVGLVASTAAPAVAEAPVVAAAVSAGTAAASGRFAASEAMVAFLSRCGLSSFTSVLVEQGFTDLEALCDKEILDDDTLAKVIGMGKKEMLAFRAAIAKEGASPTMVKQKAAAESQASKTPPKKDAVLEASKGASGVMGTTI